MRRRLPPPLAIVCASALVTALSGCATVRWVDRATEGDLLGTAGTELGALELLRDTPGDGRTGPAAADGRGTPAPALDEALDVLFGVFLTALAVW